MHPDDKMSKTAFTKAGAWLGLVAYLVLVIVIVAIFKLG